MTTAHSINIPLELVVNTNVTRLICTLPNSSMCQTNSYSGCNYARGHVVRTNTISNSMYILD